MNTNIKSNKSKKEAHAQRKKTKNLRNTAKMKLKKKTQ